MFISEKLVKLNVLIKILIKQKLPFLKLRKEKHNPTTKPRVEKCDHRKKTMESNIINPEGNYRLLPNFPHLFFEN